MLVSSPTFSDDGVSTRIFYDEINIAPPVADGFDSGNKQHKLLLKIPWAHLEGFLVYIGFRKQDNR